MRRGSRSLSLVSLALALGVALGPAAALAQADAPTSKPSAAASPTAAPNASAAPTAAPSTTAAPSATGDGALPAGHPPVGDALPAGHPPIDGADGAPPAAPANPHGAANPHGRGGPGAMGLYEPPPDTSEDDASLPAGTIVITIKDAQDRPLPRAPITLGVLHSSVAKGDSSERLTGTTDESGAARFDGLGVGSATTYRVSTTRGPATYALAPFALGDKVGKRVTLHSFEVSADLEGLLVGTQGAVYLALRENTIQVEQLVSVFNLGPVAWAADAKFDLPAGFKAFNKQESMDELRVDEVAGQGAALRGTVGPGRHDLTFRYQIPLEGNERQTIKLALPPHVAMMRVIAESSKAMGLDVTNFPASQRVSGRDGKKLLLTERQVARAEGGMPSLEITLSGLPTPGWGRWVAVGLAAAALVGGIVYAWGKREDEALDDDARTDLLEARDALLDEIVALERAHASGEVGPKTYARVRASLLDALARIVGMLERARDAREEAKKQRRPPRPVESAG